MLTMNWDEYFIRMSRLVALRSKDSSKKVGTVIVDLKSKTILATGYNGFPRGLDDKDPAMHARPGKYEETVHAEANCVANAARAGVSIRGATAYMESSPCRRCAGLLINAGVARVVACIEDPFQNQFAVDKEVKDAPNWIKDRQLAIDRLRKAGVIVRFVDVPRKDFTL